MTDAQHLVAILRLLADDDTTGAVRLLNEHANPRVLAWAALVNLSTAVEAIAGSSGVTVDHMLEVMGMRAAGVTP